jgi:quercetin dioxygenase-like cupin family protein
MRDGTARRGVRLAWLAGAAGLVAGAALGRASYPPLEVLFAGSETVIGQTIAYPEGTPKVTAAIVTMTTGQQTGWHRHDTPLLAWILEGQLTVDYGPDGLRDYGEGDAFLEAFLTPHNGRATGAGETRILAVFMGADGVANTVSDPE